MTEHLLPAESIPEVTERPSQATQMLNIVARAAADPNVNVDKMQSLLTLQRELLADQAKAEFNSAFSRLSGKMPRVKKNGRVELGAGKGSYPFSKWEDIDRIIRPLMESEGFALSFNSSPRSADGGGLVITGELLHRDGHSKIASMPLPLDTGPGRNNLQATGSTMSYGRRYVAEMLLNIVREGDDDDGQRWDAEMISDEECAELSRGLTETKSDLAAFLRFMGVTAIPEIQKKDLARARNAIEQKRQRK